MINQLTYNIYKALAAMLFILMASINGIAQNTSIINQVSLSKSLDLDFVKDEVEIEKGEIISNVLRIKNTSEQSFNFYISLNIPPQWRTFIRNNHMYTIDSLDTLYVPIRIIPDAQMKGDTKYFINANIEDVDHRQVASEYFFASTERISLWDMSVNQGNRIYLKNNESETNFDINMLNMGNERQDIVMTMSTPSSNVVLMDTSDKPITAGKYDISLDPYNDTVFNFRIKHVESDRNFKNIDLESYNPESLNEEKTFSAYFHSEEPRRDKYTNMSRSARIDFVKLTNSKKVNPYSSNVIPLTANLRVSNLMEDIVFSSLHLRGQKTLKNSGHLLYNTSLYFSSIDNFYGENYVRNIPWYVGYFDEKKNIQAGYVNGGAIGVQSSGKGIKAEYEVVDNHRVGAFYVRSPYFFNESRLSAFGVHHRYTSNNFTNLTQYAHSNHKYARLVTDVISVNPRLRLNKKHSISFTGAYSYRADSRRPDSTFAKQGFLAGAGYTSSYFGNIWNVNLRGTYTSKNFGSYGYERVSVNHRSRIKANEHMDISVVNNFNQYNYDASFYNSIRGYKRNFYFFNSVNFYSKKYFGQFQPGLFYDVRNHWGYDFHMRGLNISFSKYDITQNLQASVINTFGFSRIMNSVKSDEHFIYKLSTMVRYKNLSFTGYYNYGPLSPEMAEIKEKTDLAPQTIRTSLTQLHMMKNRHVAIQNRLSYLYTNTNSHHSLNVSPELYYFTNNGWRFSVNPTFTFYSSKIRVNYFEVPTYLTDNDNEFQRYTNDDFQISLGVKKDFGIPIPTTYSDYNTLDFVAFYDLNGNKVKDGNEPGIENVVIGLDNYRVISNTFGSAQLKNVDPGNFSFNVFSLEDLNGWFPMIHDTLLVYKDDLVYIPFVKGVKVFGKVHIEYENATPEEKRLDLSGIKISAVNGYTFHTLTGSDGSFEFYLPFGEYTITLDETVLNGRFFLIKNNYKLDLSTDVENMFITFQIVEKKRKIRVKKFGNNGNGAGNNNNQ